MLSEVSNKDYSRFSIQPERDQVSNYIFISAYRQKLGGLISNLYGEYFSDEPPPFSDMPRQVITQTQQQSVSVQMLLEFQSKIDENLQKVENGSKEEGFLKKLKSTLSAVSNVNDLLRQCMKLGKEFGLNVQDILALWGG